MLVCTSSLRCQHRQSNIRILARVPSLFVSNITCSQFSPVNQNLFSAEAFREHEDAHGEGWERLDHKLHVDFLGCIGHNLLRPITTSFPKAIHDWLEPFLHSSFRSRQAKILALKSFRFHTKDGLYFLSCLVRAHFTEKKSAFAHT
ncbi:uncharacterized protein [Triticum aestivum]|uniref:uncharacterized protein n=1 Tax=Triticum aestivum TaxID=4565 RepID=UPI001D01478B|nr:uncharacterized protein LOC123106315 [Triticum aestivum]